MIKEIISEHNSEWFPIARTDYGSGKENDWSSKDLFFDILSDRKLVTFSGQNNQNIYIGVGYRIPVSRDRGKIQCLSQYNRVNTSPKTEKLHCKELLQINICGTKVYL